MSTLYKLTEELRQIQEMAEDEELIKQFNESITLTKELKLEEIEEKAYGYAKVCKNLDYNVAQLEGQAEFLKKELDRINGKIKHSQKSKKKMLAALLEAMDLAEVSKFKNNEFIIYQSKSVTVEVTDKKKALEQNLATNEIKPDKDKIKRMLKNGEELDFAILKESKFLVIK